MDAIRRSPPPSEPVAVGLVCELCSTSSFQTLYLPDGVTPMGLVVCRDCRLVYAPKPALETRSPSCAAPDLGRYGPRGS